MKRIEKIKKKKLNNLRDVQVVPLYPKGQIHSPVVESHVPPLEHDNEPPEIHPVSKEKNLNGICLILIKKNYIMSMFDQNIR